MFYQVNTGAGIKATGAFVKRPDAPDTGAGAKADIVKVRRLTAPPNAAVSATPAPATAATPPPEPAAVVEVSDEGRELAAQKAETEYALMYVVEGPRMERTIQRLVYDVVSPKLDASAANRFTNEITTLIQGEYDGSELLGTAEERAINREKGMKLAEYVAETYIDNAEDREKFLGLVKTYSDNAVLREKGYFVDFNLGENGKAYTLTPQEWHNGTVYIPGEKEARNAAWQMAKTVFGDKLDQAGSALNIFLQEETTKILLKDPKYADIAKRYDAGEIDLALAFHYIVLKDGDNVHPDVSGFAKKVKEVDATIERVKRTMDPDAVKADVQRIIQEILSNVATQTDFIKSMLTQNSDANY